MTTVMDVIRKEWPELPQSHRFTTACRDDVPALIYSALNTYLHTTNSVEYLTQDTLPKDSERRRRLGTLSHKYSNEGFEALLQQVNLRGELPKLRDQLVATGDLEPASRIWGRLQEALQAFLKDDYLLTQMPVMHFAQALCLVHDAHTENVWAWDTNSCLAALRDKHTLSARELNAVHAWQEGLSVDWPTFIFNVGKTVGTHKLRDALVARGISKPPKLTAGTTRVYGDFRAVLSNMLPLHMSPSPALCDGALLDRMFRNLCDYYGVQHAGLGHTLQFMCQVDCWACYAPLYARMPVDVTRELVVLRKTPAADMKWKPFLQTLTDSISLSLGQLLKLDPPVSVADVKSPYWQPQVSIDTETTSAKHGLDAQLSAYTQQMHDLHAQNMVSTRTMLREHPGVIVVEHYDGRHDVAPADPFDRGDDDQGDLWEVIYETLEHADYKGMSASGIRHVRQLFHSLRHVYGCPYVPAATTDPDPVLAYRAQKEFMSALHVEVHAAVKSLSKKPKQRKWGPLFRAIESSTPWTIKQLILGPMPETLEQVLLRTARTPDAVPKAGYLEVGRTPPVMQYIKPAQTFPTDFPTQSKPEAKKEEPMSTVTPNAKARAKSILTETLDVVSTHAKHGFKVASADTTADLMLELSTTIFPELAFLTASENGKLILKFMTATAVVALVESEVIKPYEELEGLQQAAGLVIEATTRDGIQPIMEKATPILVKLAAEGRKFTLEATK